MIQTLKVINFRNFSEKKLENFLGKNFLIGQNGKGKTNLLEALSIIGNNSLLKISLDDLVQVGKDYFFIEVTTKENIFSLYYSKNEKKRKYMINAKATNKKKFVETSYTSVIFSPIFMNVMYLGPTLRRDFLDDILKSSYTKFEAIKKDYKKIVKSRNMTLRAIGEKRAELSELDFWNAKFIDISKTYYDYRFKIVDFFTQHIKSIDKFLSSSIKSIDFEYQTKVDRQDIEGSIQQYITKNQQRDIHIGKTQIGPHIDDFDIKINTISARDFVSRGEMKSIIIYLKLLEGIFIENKSGKKPILIIDDLLSELDKYHKNILVESIEYYQAFISNIEVESKKKNTYIL